MANMRQVAELAGCSPATVSRVLSGDSRFKVTDETRKKIFDAVRSLDYSLPARESSRAQIGCVLSITAEKYSDPFFTDILGAIERECETQNLAISSTKTYNELRSPNIFQEFISAGLTGVILMERIPDDMLEQISAHIPNIIFIDNDEDDYRVVYDALYLRNITFGNTLATKDKLVCDYSVRDERGEGATDWAWVAATDSDQLYRSAILGMSDFENAKVNLPEIKEVPVETTVEETEAEDDYEEE